jgi:hypothetical protein
MIDEMEHRYCMMHLDRFRQGAGPGPKDRRTAVARKGVHARRLVREADQVPIEAGCALRRPYPFNIYALSRNILIIFYY